MSDSDTRVVLYGIRNCDTMRKAMRWLESEGVEYRLHDYRRDGLEPDRLRDWCERLGWSTLLNRRGTTWRQLPESSREGIDEAGAMALMLSHPALIRRPILTAGSILLCGFDPARYRTALDCPDT